MNNTAEQEQYDSNQHDRQSSSIEQTHHNKTSTTATVEPLGPSPLIAYLDKLISESPTTDEEGQKTLEIDSDTQKHILHLIEIHAQQEQQKQEALSRLTHRLVNHINSRIQALEPNSNHQTPPPI
ncbi:hypothetical protein PGT21_010035 [Puccinia graminis f. sp. tritici]|uniref:Uncharacterized protein n=1 Tax=Puccinia graminis f. sp. tritici TaxID=56615 RepID=A0A5B0NM44_PUCGR|nr:hypothetical protein PGT21_010035 [Puccinia graminis f. sp. tritici]KAA1128787.1 hypothetical protein PGTUg99_017595 [Puccinia graminis f. sp. tritici]